MLAPVTNARNKVTSTERQPNSSRHQTRSGESFVLLGIGRHRGAPMGSRTGHASQGERRIVAEPSRGNAKALEMLEEISLDLGAELVKQRRFKTGLILANDTARRFPASARAQQMLGLFLTRNQQNPAAVVAYGKALSLSPESSDLSVGLGIAQTMAGFLPQAVKTLEEGIRKWPDDAMHYQALGVLLLRMAEEGSDTEARGVQSLQKALELNPALSEAHYRLGNIALEHGDSKSAIETCSPRWQRRRKQQDKLRPCPSLSCGRQFARVG